MGRVWRRVFGRGRCERLPGLVGAFLVGLLLACGSPVAIAAGPDARLKQAAQHFADLEDEEAKAILDELSAEGLAEADVLLGYLYADLLYQKRDYERAVVAFEQAAAGGSEEALFQLAESHFWPVYSNWPLTAREEATRPTLDEAFTLLRQVADARHYAARWRSAHLCFFGGHDCDKETTDKAITGITGNLVLGNLRTIVGAFRIIEIQWSGEADTPEKAEAMSVYLALGLAAADPFVASIVTAGTWRDIESTDQCPDLVSLGAAGRLLALEGDAVVASNGWAEFERCFDTQQAAAVREDLISSLDNLARTYSNENTWHLQTCYQAPQAPSFGDCLIHAVRHHYFACTKLSMVDYFRQQFDIHYASSARYMRCREHMLAALGR